MRRGSEGPCKRSICPVANTLDLLGDKWTLLVVRDLLLLQKRRYGDFLQSPESIPTNLLADRLRRLEECGIVRKTAYQRRPTRYEYWPTRMALDLFPVLREMIRWANRHLPGTAVPPPGFLKKSAQAARRAARI